MKLIKASDLMPATSDLVTLTNRNGQSVELKISRRQHDDRQYVFLEPPEHNLGNLTNKNANYFAVQLAKGLDVNPKAMNIIELRRGEDSTQVWRWRLKLADDFIVDTIPEEIPASNYKDFLLDLAG